MRERRTPPKRGTTRPLFTEAQLRAGGTDARKADEGRKDEAVTTKTADRPLEAGPIPAYCPCGLSEFPPDAADKARGLGKSRVMCVACGRRWSVPEVRAEAKVDDARKLLGGAATKVPGTRANRGPGAASTPPTGTAGPFAGSVDLEAETLTIAVHLHKAGDTRQVKDYEVSVTATEGNDPEKESLLLGKRLYEKEESYKKIGSFDGAITTWLDSMAFPRTNALAKGVRRYPLARVDEIFQGLEERAAKRMALVEAFIREYPEIVARARVRLGGVFNPGQFFGARVDSEGVLTVAGHEPALWERFGGRSIDGMIEVRPLSNSLPANLQTVSSKLYERASQDAAQRATREVETMVAALRQSFADMVAQLVDRLREKSKDGSAIFRDSNLENVKAFVGGFADLNRTLKDGKLGALVERAQGLLGGVDVEALKGDKDVQATVIKGLDAVQAEIASLGVVPRPKRRVLENL